MPKRLKVTGSADDGRWAKRGFGNFVWRQPLIVSAGFRLPRPPLDWSPETRSPTSLTPALMTAIDTPCPSSDTTGRYSKP